jgi:ActR/RegA family two-component response regulator
LASCDAYDLVIVDLSLASSGATAGLEIIRFVRRQCPGARLILLTAYATPEIETEALRRGAHALLRKPRPLVDIERIARELMEGAA